MAQKILIICGEPSGDVNAASLVKAIKASCPSAVIDAVGGPMLRQAGAEVFFDIKDISVMGLADVLCKLPVFLKLKKLVLERIAKGGYDCLILVDYSGFNLRLARAVKKSLPVVYYISPQVWASRSGRLKTIKKFISKVIVIFEFERDFYRKHGMEADFVGYPLLDVVKPSMDRERFLKNEGLTTEEKTIALLPGSRPSEIKRILPVMLKACTLLKHEFPGLQIFIAKPRGLCAGFYEEIIRGNEVKEIRLMEDKVYDCVNAADMALVCSGTATLETAILQKPFIIVYKTSLLNYLLYKPMVKVPFIGMVNIVAGKPLIREFIQSQATPEKIFHEALDILKDAQKKSKMISALAGVKSMLGNPGAAGRAAEIILNFIKPKG